MQKTRATIIPSQGGDHVLKKTGTEKSNSDDTYFPGTYGLPFVGKTLDFIKDTPKWMSSSILKYGPIFKTSLLLQKMIVVSDPEVAQFILRGENKIVQVDWPKPTQNLLGNGSLTVVHGEAHASIRQLLTSAFSPRMIDHLCPTVVRSVSEGLSAWASQERVKSLSTAVRSLTLQIAMHCILGNKSLQPSDFEMMREKLIKYGEGLFVMPVDVPGTSYRRAMDAKQAMLKLIGKEYARVLQKMKDLDDCMLTEDENEEPDNILEKLVWAQLSDRDGLFEDVSVVNNVLVLLFAGMDTSSSTVQTLLTILNARPEVAAKLREEQERIVAEYGDEITPAIIEKMVYLDCVITEFFQVFAVIGVIFRKAMKDFYLPGTNKLIRKDQKICISFHGQHYHHSPADGLASFERRVMELFNPDQRMKLVNEGSPSPKYQAPFGQGKRKCIGKPLAQLVTRVTFAVLLRKFEFKLEGCGPGEVPSWNWFPVPGAKGDVPFVLTPR